MGTNNNNNHVCEHCGQPATQSETSEILAECWDEESATSYACDDHARYLGVWVRNAEHEAHCESAEAAHRSDYEMDYYSGNE